MRWEEVPERVDGWATELAALSSDVRRAASRVLTSSDVGYYCRHDLEKVALFAPLASAGDLARVKAAAERASGSPALFLSYQDLSDADSSWVKVAYSPTIRSLGEALNFFPGQYPGGVPNHPSPVAAMLTSGLLGAGLGYGAGSLAGRALPHGYGEGLGRTGAMLGGALGAAPGALWALTNKFGLGRNANDPTLLHDRVGDGPIDFPKFVDGANSPSPPPVLPGGHNAVGEYLGEVSHHIHPTHADKQAIDRGLASVELGARFRAALEKVSGFGTFGDPDVAMDVNINALGQTLYDQGASPGLAATTMGAMYAAQQLPDPRARPGWATYGQLGQLAANSAGNYASGWLAGAAINAVIGTPHPASTFGAANAGLGILGAVVPKLFGG